MKNKRKPVSWREQTDSLSRTPYISAGIAMALPNIAYSYRCRETAKLHIDMDTVYEDVG